MDWLTETPCWLLVGIFVFLWIRQLGETEEIKKKLMEKYEEDMRRDWEKMRQHDEADKLLRVRDPNRK